MSRSETIDKPQDDEINVDLRTSGFDNEALIVERYALWEYESGTIIKSTCSMCWKYRAQFHGAAYHRILCLQRPVKRVFLWALAGYKRRIPW